MGRIVMLGKGRPPMLFALGASRAVAERVAQRLGIALGPLEEREFDDGEHKLRSLASVPGCDVFVLHSFRCGAENLEADVLFGAQFASLLDGGEVSVVAPDMGGMKRAEQFRSGLAQALARPVGTAFVEKCRSGGTVSGGVLVAEVGGRDVLIIDDLTASGTTLVRAASACRAHGARRAFAAATHGLFLGDAPAVLAAGGLDATAVTDTVPPFRLEDAAVQVRVSVLGCADLFAAAVARIHGGPACAPEEP